MLLTALLASLSSSECDTHGVHVEFGTVERDLSEAYYDSAHDSGTHYIYLTGSFMPKVSGHYLFTVTCETYFTSMFEPAVAHLEWDDQTVKSGKDTWEWDTDLVQDYRYPFKCATDKHFYYATLRLAVNLPDGEGFTVNYDYSDTCTILGCRNLSLTRDTNCQPPARGGAARRVAGASAEGARDVLGRGGVVAIVAGVAVGVAVFAVVVLKKRGRRGAVAALRDPLLAQGGGGVAAAELESGDGAQPI
jgi:hypothetical protein